MKQRYILSGLALLFVGSQFIPNELPPVTGVNMGDIGNAGLVDQDVAILFKS